MKKMKTLLTIVLALIFAFTAFKPVSFADEVIEIKAATWHPVGHRLTEDAYKAYGKEIEKRTNGKVKFKWFFAGTLADAAQSEKAVKSGLVDLMFPIAVWAVPSMFSVSSGVELPFISNSAKHAARMFCRMYETIPEMQKEFSEIKVLGLWSTAISNIHVKGEPPKTLADLKGMKLCTPSPEAQKVLKRLGATPVNIKLADMYMAMQRGMAEGCIFPNAPLRSYKFTDFLSGHTMGDFIVSPHITAMNLETWKSLPTDVQKVFEDMIVPGSLLCGETLTNEAKWVVEALKERGDKFYSLPPEKKAKWRDKVQTKYLDYVEILNAKGMDGEAILEKVMAASEWASKNPYGTEDWWGKAGRKD